MLLQTFSHTVTLGWPEATPSSVFFLLAVRRGNSDWYIEHVHSDSGNPSRIEMLPFLEMLIEAKQIHKGLNCNR